MDAVGTHQRDFSVQPGFFGERYFVLKAHAAAGEKDAAALGRSGKMRIVAAGVGQLPQATAVPGNGVDVGEGYSEPAGTPFMSDCSYNSANLSGLKIGAVCPMLPT